MREPKKTAELETLILNLLGNEPQVSIRSIADAAGLSKDDNTVRKLIRRALLSLEEKKSIVPKGSARSRVYVLSERETADDGDSANVGREEQVGFEGIELSTESGALLKHVSQDIKERHPVGYDQDFLRSYEPNRTFYLSPEQREKLRVIGRVESVERPAGTYARNILDRLLIDLSWNSSRLEGNTYSLLETKRLIELGETATGRDASEAQMILNHKAAIEYIVDSVQDEGITSHAIYSTHALLSENLMGDPRASGRVRSIRVGIAGTTYIPLENPQVLQECFDLFVEKVNNITDPFEKSLFSIVQLSYLQAFEDVNKRTARLVANIPLIRENLKPLSFTEVDKTSYVSSLLGVYELNNISLIRDLYLWAYDRSSRAYTAIQMAMGEPNLLKLRHREAIQAIVRSIIVEKVPGSEVVQKIRDLIEESDIPETDRPALFNLIEIEIVSLHDGNVARFKVRPSEFEAWKVLQ